MDLSIIIVNYKSVDYLLKCLESIKQHKIKDENGRLINWETIIIDNASGKNEEELLKRISVQGPKVIFNNKNIGFAAANNQALLLAKGEYICFLNPDTLIINDSLEKMFIYLRSHPEVAAVGPRCWLDEERTILISPNYLPSFSSVIFDLLAIKGLAFIEKKILLKELFSLKPKQRYMLSGSVFMTSRKIIDKVGNWDSNFFLYFEDDDWFKRIKEQNLKAVYLPEAETIHYWHQSAKKDYPSICCYYEKSLQYYFYKHSYFFTYLFLRLIMAIFRFLPSFLNYRFKNIESSNSLEIKEIDRKDKESLSSGNIFFEFSPHPIFRQAGISILKNPFFKFLHSFWERLPYGDYFGRFIAVSAEGKIKRFKPYRIRKSKQN